MTGVNRRHGLTGVAAAVLVLAAPVFPVAPVAAETHLLVVAGVGGEQAYTERFHLWATRVRDAALEAGLDPANVVYLGEREELDPERIHARSTGENVLAELTALVERSSAGDDVWIVLFGHGSGAAGPPRFNLPGRDLVVDQYADALDRLEGRRVVFVNASSASGGFIAPLSGQGRVVITATRSGGQANEALFGGYLADAFDGGAGDANKDGRTTALEAFEYARSEVEHHYSQEGLLQTENALLDDDGDGMGSLEPTGIAAEGAADDGRLASLVHLGEESMPELLTTETRALWGRREALQRQIQDLQAGGARDELDEEAYLARLEELLLALALVDRDLEDAGADPDGAPEP